MLDEWRIWFGYEEPSNKLIKPWNWKGSMEYVHEVWINQWISHASIDKCDLCGYKLKTQEKLLNPFKALKRLLRYMNRDKKRYVYWFLYIVYLYLYGKRVAKVMTSFLNIFRWWRSTHLRDKIKIFKALFTLVYNSLLFIQLIYLGAIESKRIWNIIHIISRQVKSIKILDKQEEKLKE